MVDKGILLQDIHNVSPTGLVIPAANRTTGSDNKAELNAASVVTGAWTPTATSTVPSKVGEIYVDTTAHKVWIAEDTADVNGFLILN